MKRFILSLVFLASFIYSDAQVGINILQPDSSAILHLESTDKGLLLPRLTTTQMEGINNPVHGLTVYNVEDSLIYYYNNECWLKVYQKNCYECDFVMSIDQSTASIDHVVTDSAFANITVEQLNGTEDIVLATLATLPPDIDLQITNSTIDSFGVATISVYANIFSTPGTYPIIVQAVCGQTVRFVTFTVTVEPCLYVPIASNQSDLDLQQFGTLPGPGNPVCVIAELFNNVVVDATDITGPAMTWGNLDPMSHVGFINDGAVLGRGGDGGDIGNITSLQFGEDGEDGGDALELTTKTTFDLNGEIYGGGGGGAGIGTGLQFTIPIVNINIFLGLGYGGGGGSEDGLGGQAPNLGVVIGQIVPGGDATSGVTSVPGDGAQLAGGIDLVQVIGAAVGVTIPGLYANLNGGLFAGDGGEYGEAGGNSNASVGIDIGVAFSIPPFININIPIYNGSFPLGAANGGAPGYAIKTNTNTTINLVLPNGYIKGAVAP